MEWTVDLSSLYACSGARECLTAGQVSSARVENRRPRSRYTDAHRIDQCRWLAVNRRVRGELGPGGSF